MKLQRIVNFAAVLFLGGAMAVIAQTPTIRCAQQTQ